MSQEQQKRLPVLPPSDEDGVELKLPEIKIPDIAEAKPKFREGKIFICPCGERFSLVDEKEEWCGSAREYYEEGLGKVIK